MKKEYKKPEIIIENIDVEDIITTSGIVKNSFNPFGLDNENPDDTWQFE